jgi:putative Ca2+/H+ antiporter (TMEM165/GDT1 family)
MVSVLVAFGVVFVAELGDKSQLVALTLATRYPARTVLAALLVACVVLHGLAVTVGVGLAQAVPHRALGIASGSVFLAIGSWELLRLTRPLTGDAGINDEPSPEADELVGSIGARSGSVVIGIALTFAVSELGDKTQLATAALAGRNGAGPTFIGAVVGMLAADGLAIALGATIQRRFGLRTVRIIATTGFLLSGFLILATSL